MNPDQQLKPKQESATQRFYREMVALRPRLPKDWKMRFFKKHPEYDNYGASVLVGNVYYLRSTDAVILEYLKEIANEFEKEKGGK